MIIDMIVKFQLAIVLILFFAVFTLAYKLTGTADLSFIITIITNIIIYVLILYGDGKYGTHDRIV
jgi:hypothetical protein